MNNEEKSTALSQQEKKVFFAQLKNPQETIYNITLNIEIEGKLNTQRLEFSLNRYVQEHPGGKSIFILENGIIRKKIIDKPLMPLEKITPSSKTDIKNFINYFKQPFDLSQYPLFRYKLIELNTEKHFLLLDFHILIHPRNTENIFVKDVFDIYFEDRKQEKLRIHYSELEYWQKSEKNEKEIYRQKEYWLNALSGHITPTTLPTDFPRPPVLDYKGSHHNFCIDGKRYRDLLNFSKKLHTDPSIIIFTLFNVLIAKASGKEDLIVGFPVFGKMGNDTKISKHLNFIINRLPIRNKINKDKTFISLLDDIKHKVLEAFRNQNYPISELYSELDIDHDQSYSFLFNIAFSWFNIKTEKRRQKAAVGTYVFDNKKVLFDIFLKGAEAEDRFNLSIEYSTLLFKESTIISFKKRILTLIDNILDNHEKKIEDIEIFLPGEKHKILNEFNKTETNYPRNKTAVDIFRETAKNKKHCFAVVQNEKQLTYNELNIKSENLASLLKDKRIGKGDIVGILLKPGIDMIISIFGVLKTGAAYVPISIEYPEDRIEYMLDDSNSPILITTKELLTDKIKSSLKAEILDINNTDLSENVPELEIKITPNDIAYVIYTSGSTGKPKGVMIRHTSLVNLCMWSIKEFNITENDNCTKYLGVAFDASVQEIFPTILGGAALHIIQEEMKLNLEYLSSYYNDNRITISTLPTQFAEIFMTTNTPYLKSLVIGGDKLKTYIHKNYDIINAYGPTEATVSTTVFRVDKKYDNIPIGKPISNYKVYIIDNKNKLRPIGFPGEICISGIALAKGYLNREQLTKEKFILNPFATEEQKKNGYDRLYKTGDLGRWLPDGNIEFLGRIDFQVKIRGYRIELGEIENKIKACPYIKENTVIARTSTDGQKYLCAFYTKKEDFDINVLKRTIAKTLPDYMVPASFIEVDEIPITANGKVDTRKLEQYKEEFTATEYVPPINDSEKIICTVWANILGTKIGRINNFFLSGGNSIKAIASVSELQKDFEITINSIFEFQTSKALAKQIKRKTMNLKESLDNLKSEIINEEKELSKYHASDEYKTIINTYIERNKEYNNIDITKEKTYRNILLTGSTGYLGSYLTYYIFKTTDANIYLPVRGKDQNESIGRLKHKLNYYFGNEIINDKSFKDRVHILNSDLAKPQLGLSTESYSNLVNNIDVIIHAAANVSHYGEYTKYYASNVQSTLNLLQLAEEGIKKDFNYISTRDVVEQGYIENQKFYVLSEYDSKDKLKQEYPNNYIKTKYEAENAVIDARKRNINTNIFRLGNLVFDSEKGGFQENITTNAFFILLKAFVKVGAVNNLIDNAELSYIDTTAKGILALYNKINLKNEIYHLYNFRREQLSNIISEKYSFLKLRDMKLNEFIDQIYLLYDDPKLNTYARDILTHFGFFDQTNSTSFEVLTDKTEYLLDRCGVIWQPLKSIGFDKMHRMLAEAHNLK